MEQNSNNSTGGGCGKRDDRVLHITGGCGESTVLADVLQKTLDRWDSFDNKFISKCDGNGLVLKLKRPAHNEKIITKTEVQHGDTIALIGVYGSTENRVRVRLLGYVLLYDGNPTIHPHTWFASICYSKPKDVRRKDFIPLISTDQMRLFRVGMDVYDYFLVYLKKTREHDEAGFSDGATHLETAEQWKDGL